MKNVTKGLLGAIAVAVSVLQIPAVHSLVVLAIAGHPAISGLVAGVAAIVALLHNPNAPTAKV